MQVDCDACGESFDSTPAKVERNDNNFCGRDCYYQWRRDEWSADSQKKEKVELTCEHCSDAFKVHQYREDSARFCSRECKDESMAGKSGSETPAWDGKTVEYTCMECGTLFEDLEIRGREYCSKRCYRRASKELFKGENNPVWRGGWTHYYGANWDEQRQKAIARDDHECQDCGIHADDMDRSPDVHHKKRIGWFKEEYDAPEWWQEANQLDNLVTLCRSCHQKREWSSD